MTEQEVRARRYSRRCRQRRRAARLRRIKITVLILLVLTLLLLCYLSACGTDLVQEPPVSVETEVPLPVEETETPMPEVSVEPTPTAEIEETTRYRDDIPLEAELQEIMWSCCEKYEVPFALAVAMAQVESTFNPDAVSPTNDYGLMQINQFNHEWLQGLGMDPLTYAGNIEAGIYMISQHIQSYGEIELALMAYNSGPSGARKLWDAGTYQTSYSRKVMTAYETWLTVLEE